MQQESWYARHWRWFIPALCLAVLAMTAISLASVLAIVSFSMKSLGAYQAAVQRAQSDPRVTAALGAPLREGWFVTGSFHVTGASGKAELAIPVSGPRGKGTIYLAATESVGEWSFSHLIFQVHNSQERINLQDKATAR